MARAMPLAPPVMAIYTIPSVDVLILCKSACFNEEGLVSLHGLPCRTEMLLVALL